MPVRNIVNIDELRQTYLNMPPYTYDVANIDDIFTEEEKADIRRYGNWFDAIWSDQVPLTSDKLKRFYDAKFDDCKVRNKYEELWYQYKKRECPF